jgi:hypothetical protein
MRHIGLVLYMSIFWFSISLAEDSTPPRLVAPPPPSHSYTDRPPLPKPLASEPAADGATLQTSPRADCPTGYEKAEKYCLKIPVIKSTGSGGQTRACGKVYTLVGDYCLRNPVITSDHSLSCPPGHELAGGYCMKLPKSQNRN